MTFELIRFAGAPAHLVLRVTHNVVAAIVMYGAMVGVVIGWVNRWIQTRTARLREATSQASSEYSPGMSRSERDAIAARVFKEHSVNPLVGLLGLVAVPIYIIAFRSVLQIARENQYIYHLPLTSPVWVEPRVAHLALFTVAGALTVAQLRGVRATRTATIATLALVVCVSCFGLALAGYYAGSSASQAALTPDSGSRE